MVNKRSIGILVAVAALMTAACSNRAVYDNIQNDQRWRCDQEPPSQQRECREQVNRPYSEYERQRTELLEPAGD